MKKYLNHQTTSLSQVLLNNTLFNYFEQTKKRLIAIYENREAINICKLIFANICNLDYANLSLSYLAIISDEQICKLELIIQRLEKHEPIQYILEEAWFYREAFYVNSNVLIPRPETETIIDFFIRSEKAMSKKKVLDIGTGSACIAICLKKAFVNWQIRAIDNSAEAISVAKKNAIKLNAEIDFALCDILKDDIACNYMYDIIVSNPPYIPLAEKPSIMPQVLMFEPLQALFVHNDNELIFIKQINACVKKYLQKKGILIIEIHPPFSAKIKEYLLKQGFYYSVEILKDMQQLDRFVVAYKA